MAIPIRVERKGVVVTLTIPCGTPENAKDVAEAFAELYANLEKHPIACLRGIMERGENCTCGHPLLGPKFEQLVRPKFELSQRSLAQLARESLEQSRH